MLKPDTLLLFLAMLVTALLVLRFELFDVIYTFTRKHESYELDEFILILAISSIYLGLFTLKRFHDLRVAQMTSNTDFLLNISNRRKGLEILQEVLAQPYDPDEPLSLIMFDIDHFKRINDTYGHETGDSVLIEVTTLTRSSLRERDSFIRWGGEEFLIVCPQTSCTQAQEVAERLRLTVESFRFQRVTNRVTASFGVYERQADDELRTLISRVDKNLYRSKNGGRNRVTAQ